MPSLLLATISASVASCGPASNKGVYPICADSRSQRGEAFRRPALRSAAAAGVERDDICHCVCQAKSLPDDVGLPLIFTRRR